MANVLISVYHTLGDKSKNNIACDGPIDSLINMKNKISQSRPSGSTGKMSLLTLTEAKK